MMSINSSLNIFLISFVFFENVVASYEVPPALVEPLTPRGFRVSIPDHEGITLFAFHGNVNEDFENGHEAGKISVDVLRKKNGRWTYTNRDVKLNKGDTLYYWLTVHKDGLGYERLFQSHLVTEFYESTGEPKPSSGNKPPPVTPPSHTPSPPNVTPQEDRCKNSPTQVNGATNICKGELVFNSEFKNGINKYWNYVVQFGEDDSEFTIFDNDPYVTRLNSDSLEIRPVFLDQRYTEGFAIDNTFDLTNRCTSSVTEYCIQTPVGRNILPCVLSARITTEHNFSFRYGKIEIKAKLPHGDWVVPEIWLLPKSYQFGKRNSGKIFLGMSFGNDDLNINGVADGNHFLHSGLQVGNESIKYGYTKTSSPFSDDYHLFKLVWEPDRIQFYFDDQEYGSWNSQYDQPLLKGQSNKIAPFNQDFYLILGVHVGGTVDFPDDCINRGKPKLWKNGQVKRKLLFYKDSENWLQTWDDRTALRVEHVKVWAL